MRLSIPPSLKHRQFAYLWSGQAVSIIGSQMQVWALLWHINTIAEEPIYLGLVGLARVIPIVVLSIFGGAVADLVDRRKLLLVTQSSQAGLALTLWGLTISGNIQLWHIYLITALQAVAFAYDVPARQALVPNLVPRDTLPNALSMYTIASQIGSIVGPAIGGLVIAGAGLGYTYLFNAISFLSVIAALVAMGEVKQDRGVKVAHTKVDKAMIVEGLRFTFGNPLILGSMVLDFVATFFASANTLMPVFAREVLGVGARGFGILSAAQSAGAVSAALVLSQIKQIRKQGRISDGGGGGFWYRNVDFWAVPYIVAFLVWVGFGGRVRYGKHGDPPDDSAAADPRWAAWPDDQRQSDLLRRRSAAG